MAKLLNAELELRIHVNGGLFTEKELIYLYTKTTSRAYREVVSLVEARN